jgi:tRNA(Ile)-lysidine synthase
LRGVESDADEAFVSDLCARLDLPLELIRVDAAAIAAEIGVSVEEAGRAVRYAFFDEVAEKYVSQGKILAIALAHNQDDQVETVLMRILRGTGTDGLAGIPLKRESGAGFAVVRPLLCADKQEILSYLATRGIEYRVDGSNHAREQFRNRIRMDILPMLEETAKICVKRSLLRISDNAAIDRDYFDALCEELLDTHFSNNQIAVKFLTRLHPAIRRRVIVKAFARIGLTSDIAAVHLMAAERLVETAADSGAGGKRVEFPYDYTLGIERGMVVFRSPGVREANWKARRTSG